MGKCGGGGKDGSEKFRIGECEHGKGLMFECQCESQCEECGGGGGAL